jgi:hypothetical protein
LPVPEDIKNGTIRNWFTFTWPSTERLSIMTDCDALDCFFVKGPAADATDTTQPCDEDD